MVDPRIILAGAPTPAPAPQILTPVQARAQVQQLRNLAALGQMRQQQTEGLQLQNQQTERALQNQQLLRDAFTASGGDPQKALALAAQSGVDPGPLLQFQGSILDARKKAADLSQEQREIQLAKNTTIQSRLAPALSIADPQKRAQAVATQVQGLVSDGTLSPQEGQSYLEAEANGSLKTAVAGLNFHNSLLNQAKQAQIAASNAAKTKDEAALPGVQAQSEQQVRANLATRAANAFQGAGPAGYAKFRAGLPPDQQAMFPAYRAGIKPADFLKQLQNVGLTSQQQTQNTFKTAEDAERVRHDKAMEENAAKAAEGYSVSLSPEAMNMAADMYIQTGILPSLGRGKAAAAERLELLNVAAARHPNADIAGNKIDWANRKKTLQAFTTGTQGQQINAMNTAIGHLDQLGGAIADLGNGDIRAVNSAKNWLKTEFGGSADVTNFDTLKVAVSGELASVLKRSGATDREIEEVQKTLLSKNSPEQLAGYIRTQIPILGSKLAALNYQYHQAMGAQDPFSALSPDSKAILQKYGFNPDHPVLGGSATSQSGASTSLPSGNGRALDPITASKFLAAAGNDKDKARELARQHGWKF